MAEKTQRVGTVHVLVHPHFVLHNPLTPSFGRKVEDFSVIDLRKKRDVLTQQNQAAENVLKRQEVIDRFYRAEIRRISKKPRDKLVILKGIGPQRKASIEWAVEYGVPEEIAASLADHVVGFQERLIQYAQNKMGKKLTVLSVYPERVAEHLVKIVDRKTPVVVFGEYLRGEWSLGGCVNWAAESLRSFGFNAEICRSKSIG